jgi:hypothetical protein
VTAKEWIWCVESIGSQWTIEKVLVNHDSNEAVIERPDQGNPRLCAAPAVQDIPIGELVDFDYKGRGSHLRHE